MNIRPLRFKTVTPLPSNSPILSPGRPARVRSAAESPRREIDPIRFFAGNPLVVEGLRAGPRSLATALRNLTGISSTSDNPHYRKELPPKKSAEGYEARKIIDTAFPTIQLQVERFIEAIVLQLERRRAPVQFHFEYDVDDHLLLMDPLHQALEAEGRLQLPGILQKSHLSFFPLGEDRYAFSLRSYGSNASERVMELAGSLERISVENIPVYVEPAEKRPQNPTGRTEIGKELKIRPTLSQVLLAGLDAGLAITSSVAPWFYLPWWGALATMYAYFGLRVFLGYRLETKLPEPKSVSATVQKLESRLLLARARNQNDLGLEALTEAARTLSSLTFSVFLSDRDHKVPFRGRILSARYQAAVTALENALDGTGSSAEVTAKVAAITAPITNREFWKTLTKR